MKHLLKLVIAVTLVAGLSSCSDFLKPSVNQHKTVNSINGINDLKALINGAYFRLGKLGLYERDYLFMGDVRTDNAFVHGRDFAAVGRFNYLPTGQFASEPWEVAYQVISNCNLIINSDVASSPEVDQVVGEAYAMRALSHMILLELYGEENVDGSNLGIPYVTKFLGEGKSFPKRLTVEATNKKISADFEKAIQLMDPSIARPTTKMTYYGALALAARHYMFTEEYGKAAAAAKKVIKSKKFHLVSANQYVSSWKVDGQPAVIFGIDYNNTSPHLYQIDGVYSLTTQRETTQNFAYGIVEITKELYNLFENSDVRKDLYTVYPSHFKPKGRKKYRITGKFTEPYANIPVIRYAEVILTYAEAELRRDNPKPSIALTYLNKIPSHRNASTYNVATIKNVLLERRKELAMEGHYFWTLMRTKQDIVRESMRPAVSNFEITIPYGDHRLALPIPQEEINANPNIKQNVGY